MNPAQWIETPHLPAGRVTTVICQENAELVSALERQGIACISTAAYPGLNTPVNRHPDCVCAHLGGKEFLAAPGQPVLCKKMSDLGFQVKQTAQKPTGSYPDDCIMNAAQIGRTVFANTKHLAPELQSDIAQGIAQAAADTRFNVLVLEPGGIRLEGHPYGFIGGCTVKLSPEKLAFYGDVNLHPQGERIKAFLRKHGVTAVNLAEGHRLEDVGSIIPILESRACIPEKNIFYYTK